MGKVFKRLGLIGMVLLLSLSLVSFALATPPGQARKANSEKHQDKEEQKIVPPGLRENRTPPGLVDKGGLPPGLHGRSLDELPPGIRNNRNFQEAIERLKEEEKEKEIETEYTLTVAGSEFIIIPDEGALTATYKAFLADEDDNEEAVTASWELKDDKTGVSIDEDGVLEVTTSAQPGTITVIANYTTGEDDAESNHTGGLTVELYKQEVGEIKISGTDFYTLRGDEKEPLQFEYKATVLDQKGEVMAEDVNWSTISPDYDAEDMTFDVTANGTLIVEIPATAGQFTVKAIRSGIEKTLLVTIYSSTISSIEIVGSQLVALTDEDESPLTLEYTAIVKDQQGKVMVGERVSWHTISTFAITLETNENVTTVKAPATDGKFTLIATAGGITETLAVTVYTQSVASIAINGEKFVTLQEGDEELILEYVATVKDQEGQVMEDVELIWSAETEAEFSLDDGEITLTELPAPGDEIEFTLAVEYMDGEEVIKKDSLTVIVYHPEVNNIKITGTAEITLPAAGEVTEDYKVVILDQNNQKIEADVIWLLADEGGEDLTLTGVTLENGTITITKDADKGSFWLWVVYEDKHDTFQVEIV